MMIKKRKSNLKKATVKKTRPKKKKNPPSILVYA